MHKEPRLFCPGPPRRRYSQPTSEAPACAKGHDHHEEGERILERRAAARLGRLGQEDMSVRDGVSDFVAWLDPKRGADSLRNGCLSLAGEFAGDHADAPSVNRWWGKSLRASSRSPAALIRRPRPPGELVEVRRSCG